MARAKRHYIPGQIWHITHRCHKRDFLLKFGKDRRRWLQWLFAAKKRYGLTILNYTVTSNHIHLLVADDGDCDVIPRSIQLVAGRIGQEYNKRKKRKGAFWEDRYHSTAIEQGEHFLRCLIYIDLNMVRAGVVEHPSAWPYCGYNEIQAPKRKNSLIDYDRLQGLLGFKSYALMKQYYKDWIEETLKNEKNERQTQWTMSVAVGNKNFVEQVKTEMGALAIGKKIRKTEDIYQLREDTAVYGASFDTKNNDIEPKNAHFWRPYIN